MGVTWNIAQVSQKALEKVLRTPWTLDRRSFSDRIWSDKARLLSELRTHLSQGLMLGKSPDALARMLSERLGVSRSNAARLAYTESAYFHAAAQEDAFRALGVKAVVFVATLDDKTSDICRAMDGRIIDMKDYQPGVTVPPLHPWCRSTTAPHEEALAGIGERAARDPETGQTYYVPREMTYGEWEKAFVKGGSKEGLKQEIAATAANVAKVAAYRRRIVKAKQSELKNGLPLNSEPDSIMDMTDDGGETLQRRVYGSDGMAMIDYDTTDHNRPDAHTTGAHKHVWSYLKKRPDRKMVPMEDADLILNSDIIIEGVKYHDPQRTDRKN